MAWKPPSQMNQIEQDYATARKLAGGLLTAWIVSKLVPLFGIACFLYMLVYPLHAYWVWSAGEIGIWFPVLAILLDMAMLGLWLTGLKNWFDESRQAWRTGQPTDPHIAEPGPINGTFIAGMAGLVFLIVLHILDMNFAVPRSKEVDTPWGTITTIHRDPGADWKQGMSFPEYDEEMAKTKIWEEKKRLAGESADASYHGYRQTTAKYWNVGYRDMQHVEGAYGFWREELKRYQAAHPDYVEYYVRWKNRTIPPMEAEMQRAKGIAEKWAQEIMSDSSKERYYPDFDREYNENRKAIGSPGEFKGLWNSSAMLTVRRYIGADRERQLETMQETWEEDYPNKMGPLGTFLFDFTQALEDAYVAKHPKYKTYYQREHPQREHP